jgi:hypothetical protein
MRGREAGHTRTIELYSTPRYVFMAMCLINWAQGQLYLYICVSVLSREKVENIALHESFWFNCSSLAIGWITNCCINRTQYNWYWLDTWLLIWDASAFSYIGWRASLGSGNRSHMDDDQRSIWEVITKGIEFTYGSQEVRVYWTKRKFFLLERKQSRIV